MKKSKKYLSDGTEAKVGMIVVVIDGDSFGNISNTITKITSLKKIEIDLITCESQRITFNNNISTKIPSWFERLSDLRKATAEERKKYYNQKNN